jgi:hypothetical protein
MRNRRGLVALAFVVIVVAAGCDVVRGSVSSAGGQANGPSRDVSLSAGANLMAFDSEATNLVPGDTNGFSDVFVRDAKRGTTTMVTVARGGGPANGASSDPVVSADARYVAFRSSATNLVTGAPETGIYLRDLRAHTTTLVSKDANGAALPLVIPGPIVISATGRFVVFSGNFDVDRYDGQSGFATQVLTFLRQPTGVSQDGRYLATDTISVVGVHSRAAAVFDLTTGQATFVGPIDSWATRITPDAKYVAFAFAPNCFPSFFPSCTAGASGARLHNLQTGEEFPLLTTLGEPFADVTALGLSNNAQRVAIATADNAYLLDRTTGAFTLVTEAKDTPETGNQPTREATISADGSTVGFASDASNLVDNDTNNAADAFSRRL